MRRGVLIAIVLVVIVALAVAGGVYALGGRNYRAHMSGPANVTTQGQGEATFQFSSDHQSLHYRITVANINNVTQAHIHLASTPGGNGGIVVWLYPANPPATLIPGRSDGVLMEGTITAANLTGALAGKSLNDLKAAMDQGLTYVNVHTTAYPGGEIRGDIR